MSAHVQAVRVALYVRVSTSRQVQHQTIEQQLEQLHGHVRAQAAWALRDEHVFRDDGYTGAALARPGLDRLLVTAPNRLARNYVHQMVLLEEFAHPGCAVEFLDRPMSDDPHDQLLLQIRGAVAEYERTLIAERMRRGRLSKLQAGLLLPWTRPPYGYRLAPGRPRDQADSSRFPKRALLSSVRRRRRPSAPLNTSCASCETRASPRATWRSSTSLSPTSRTCRP